MSDTFLITGGCGFLGANLAHALLKQNKKVIIFDNLSRFGSEKNLTWLKQSGDVNFYHGDTSNYNDINRVIKQHQPNVIYHLAGQVAMTTSIQNPTRDFMTNAQGTLNVLTSVKDYSKESIIIYSSTNKVYGDLDQYELTETQSRYICQAHPHGYDERTPLDFRSPYGCSKGTADQYMLDFHRIYGLKTVVFRHSSICGDRQFCTYDQGWVGWFVQQALCTLQNKDHHFDISGTGKQVRDILFAPDLIRCYFLATEHISTCQGHAFNIGGGYENSLSLLELFSYLEKQLAVKINYHHLPWRQSDQKIFIADIKKAKEFFNWTPTIDKWTGINNVLKWTTASAKSY